MPTLDTGLHWLDALLSALDGAVGAAPAAVLVSVARVRGSTPREEGAAMAVTPDGLFGTVGGGNLEYQAIHHAREMLRDGAGAPAWRDYPLGPALGQCCGGVASLLFEPVDARALMGWAGACRDVAARGEVAARAVPPPGADVAGPVVIRAGDDPVATLPPRAAVAAGRMLAGPMPVGPVMAEAEGGAWALFPVRDGRAPLWLYGAGHVGRALVDYLSGLPFRVTWVDARAEMFPPEGEASGAIRRVAADPVATVADGPPGAFWLVMTHDHGLDLELCAAILARGDAAWAGLIGSETKHARFDRRLRDRGLPDAAVDALVCPIGLPEVRGKTPRAVALATAAQLLAEHGRRVAGL